MITTATAARVIFFAVDIVFCPFFNITFYITNLLQQKSATKSRAKMPNAVLIALRKSDSACDILAYPSYDGRKAPSSFGDCPFHTASFHALRITFESRASIFLLYFVVNRQSIAHKRRKVKTFLQKNEKYS